MWVLILEPDPHILLQQLMSRKIHLCSRIGLASSLVPVLGFASSSFLFSSLSVKSMPKTYHIQPFHSSIHIFQAISFYFLCAHLPSFS
jgi:hypothetical protein